MNFCCRVQPYYLLTSRILLRDETKRRRSIAILNKNGTEGRSGTAPVKEAPAVYGSEKFLYAYGTQANENQVGLLYPKALP